MNSHTKPRHGNKQALIYLLPVSWQMPGRAGSTAGRWGTGTRCGRILAWEDEEGSIPPSPPTHSPVRVVEQPHTHTSCTPHPPQQPHAMSPRPVLGCSGWGRWQRGQSCPDPDSPPHGTAESGRYRDRRRALLLPSPVPCTGGCQGIMLGPVQPPRQHWDRSPFGLWKLQGAGGGI